MISIKNVTKTFNQIKAVDDVTLSIAEGTIYGIIGYSGAGKSTLIRMINQLEVQDQGSIEIDGVKIEAQSKKELLLQRRKIGMIFQHFNLMWSRTVAQNIALPLELAGVDKTQIQKRVKELLEIVDLQGKENSYPSNLSGGQKQRVAIARALANNPSILLCDEATSALDPKTTQSILDLLKEINQKMNLTIVLITHQMEVVQKLCHRVAVMVEGKVVEEGDVDSIFKNPVHVSTKHFVNTTVGFEEEDVLENLKAVYQEGFLLRLTFGEVIARQPIISEVMKEAIVDLSIVHANLSNTIVSSFGTMVVYGQTNDLSVQNEVIEMLKNKGVIVEVIS